MSRRALRFESIDVEKVPGFNPPGFSVSGFKPQVNIIYGPNAVGKTTLSRALRCLVWPEASAEKTNVIRGSFFLDERRWTVEIDSGSIDYQQDGAPSPGPALPSAEHAARYFIALHELLQNDTCDESFAGIIIRESAGGYQLSDAVNLLGYKDRPSRAGQTTRLARNKIKEWREVSRKQQELEDSQRELEPLHIELEGIERARQRLEIIEQIIVYRQAEDDYQDVLIIYRGFPEEMALLKGDEEEGLNRLKEEIRRCRQRIGAAERKLAGALEVLEEAALPEEGIGEKFFAEIRNKRDKLNKYETRVEELKADLQEARTRLEGEKINLAEVFSEEELAGVEKTVYRDLSDFARKAGRVHQRHETLKKLRGYLNPEKKAPGEEGVIEKGVRLLEDWLRAPEESWEGRRKLERLTLISGLTISALTLLLVLLVTPWFSPLFIPAGILIWYGYSRGEPVVDYRQIAREEYAGLGLDPPAAWEKAAVRRRLQELADLAAEIRFWQSKQDYWESLEEEYRETVREVEDIEQERAVIAARYGLAPGTDEQALFYLSECIISWQRQRKIAQGLTGKLEEYQGLYDALLQESNHMLERYGYEEAADAAGISGNIVDLQERSSLFREAMRDKREAGEIIERDRAGLQEAEEELKSLYAALGLEAGDEAGLKELCYRYQDYKGVEDELRDRASIRRREKEKLLNLGEVDRDFLEGLLEQGYLEKRLPELEEIKGEYLERAGRHDGVYKRITEIEASIKLAKNENRVEAALAEKERALDKLEAELSLEYERLAGKVLADYIKEVHTVENRPGVFRRAREIFAEITRGGCQLEVSDGEPPAFRAVDTFSGLGKGLDELSSGTRIQLLLAVRMAFVDQEEGEIILPLYLDETLANADDERARAIIEAVIELARRGRQCFYFTAQQDEVRKWLSIMEVEGDIDYRVVNLSGEQSIDWDVSIPVIKEIPGLRPVPAAEGLSPGEYREKVRVPGFDPRKGAGSAHLWYLTDDMELLSYFLQLGISSWGQLKALLENGREGLVPGDKEEALQGVILMGLCLEEFIQSWKVGRGDTVDSSVLEDSGAVSPTFIEAVSALARDVEGDAAAIIRELRQGAVSNFRTQKTDELESYFEEEGYINQAAALSGEEIYRRLLGVIISEEASRNNFCSTGSSEGHIRNSTGILKGQIRDAAKSSEDQGRSSVKTSESQEREEGADKVEMMEKVRQLLKRLDS